MLLVVGVWMACMWAGDPTANPRLLSTPSTSLHTRPVYQERLRTPDRPGTGLVAKRNVSCPQPALIEGIQPELAGCQ